MADHGHFLRARDRGDIGQHVGPRGGRAGDRDVLQILQRLHVVLRRLGGQVVVDAVGGIQEEHRRRLEAAAQRVEHAGRHIAFGEAALLRLGAVHIDLEIGIVERLLDARIDDARHVADLLEDRIGHFAVALQVGAFDLDVDRGGQAEIQHLGDDIGGQEIEGHAGKLLRQDLAQTRDISVGRPVIGLERYHDIGVRRADQAGDRMRQIDRAVGQADIVGDRILLARRDFLPDDGLDEIGKARRLLDSRAGFGAHVQDELAAVRAREEILPQLDAQRHHGQDRAQEHRAEDDPMRDQPGQNVMVSVTEPLETGLESLLEAPQRIARGALLMLVGAQQIHGQGRHQRARQHIGGQHREAPPPRPAARTGSAPRRPAGTSAGRRCRCTGVETRAGTAICEAPLRIASMRVFAFLQIPFHVLDRDRARRRPGCRRPAPGRPAS